MFDFSFSERQKEESIQNYENGTENWLRWQSNASHVDDYGCQKTLEWFDFIGKINITSVSQSILYAKKIFAQNKYVPLIEGEWAREWKKEKKVKILQFKMR